MTTDYGAYEAVIGLEVHAQLLTRTKAFCSCATSFGDPPNVHTCPVCLGLPGSLPVLNEGAVRMAVRAALALGCTVHERSIFARKNYFYPDLPKGYQISQYDRPLATAGSLEIDTAQGPKRAGITRVHMEEDAGKNLHGVGDESVVDLNRAGTPLIEIVGEPDLRSGAEAGEYLRRLREILMFLEVNDGNLEQGSFRCDANVSVRRAGEAKLGTRTELKNINSFRFVEAGIDVEIRRQIALLERGELVRQQTRGYSADKRETYLLRDKESEAGYRYFPEPDLPPLALDAAFVESMRGTVPESPADRRRRLVSRLGLTPQAAGVLCAHPRVFAFFEEASALHHDPVRVANFVQSEVLRDVRTAGLDAIFPVTPAQVAELLRLVDEGAISGKQAKEVHALVCGTGRSPAEVVKERGMAVLRDEASLEAMARALIEQNPKQAAGYRAGKATLLGFFVGQMMKQTGGSASPAVVNAVLTRLLSSGAPPQAATEEAPMKVEPDPGPAKAQPKAPEAANADHADHAARQPPGGPRSASGTPITLPSGPGPMPATIPYDDFARLDLRVGVVVSAERVPRKDKLLDLRVDVGDPEGPRRIVAGLGMSFTPEQLAGQRVVVLCNLAPRTFSKDLVSHGMLLASGPSDGLGLVTVGRDLPPGTRVK